MAKRVIGQYQGKDIYAGTDAEVSAQMRAIDKAIADSKKKPDSKTSTKTKTKQKEEEDNKRRSSRDDDEDEIDFEKLIDRSDLDDDIKEIARAVFTSISTNDMDYAKRLMDGIDKATKYADPYFKTQTRLVRDALERGFQESDDDLEFNEARLTRELADLREDVAKSRDTLGLDEQQELAALERSKTQELDNLRGEMASLGFTQSSIRAKKENFTEDVYGDLRETKTRQFAVKQDALATALERGERDTEAEVERLRELTKSGKVKLLREAEEKVGSDALRDWNLGDLKPLRNVVGSLQNQRAKEISDLATKFVF